MKVHTLDIMYANFFYGFTSLAKTTVTAIGFDSTDLHSNAT